MNGIWRSRASKAQLERSQLRRKQVEEVIGEEVAAYAFNSKGDGRGGIAPRRPVAPATVADAKAQKMERCRREEQLLVQLQDVRQRTSEDAVAASLALRPSRRRLGLVAIELC